MTEEDLDLIETKDLVHALYRGFSGIVIVGLRSPNSDEELTDVFYGGGWAQAVGLCVYGKDYLLDVKRNPEEEE